MWIFLLWILFPGGWAVTGPTQVMVNQGSSLVVSCSYEPGYELYPKFWCQRGFLGLCTSITQTDGSEVTVTRARVSIKDNHTSHSFTVTLDHVTLEDAGWYSCGVKRKMWFSLKHSTKVMVSKGKARLGAKQGCLMEAITWERGSQRGIMGVVKSQGRDPRVQGWGGSPLCSLFSFTSVSSTAKGNDASPLATTAFGEPPVVSQLSITYLLLTLCVKVPVALLLVCVAVWVRSQSRNCGQENLQL
ncbi:CMRF35-like molecule 7 [Lathamus discolor]|uniref:CMRF35-like molecule 7 n=1 Tax=Lathamus discolor TaxID=678569 RepID=UPI0032B86168